MPDSWFDATTSFALDRINAGSTVLAHCHMGINRGPSTAYAILLTLGWDPVDAVDHIRAVRPIAAVFYAEDAVRWASRRQELLPAETNHQISRLADWRAAHPMEAGRTMRAPRIEPLPQQQRQPDIADAEQHQKLTVIRRNTRDHPGSGLPVVHNSRNAPKRTTKETL